MGADFRERGQCGKHYISHFSSAATRNHKIIFHCLEFFYLFRNGENSAKCNCRVVMGCPVHARKQPKIFGIFEFVCGGWLQRLFRRFCTRAIHDPRKMSKRFSNKFETRRIASGCAEAHVWTVAMPVALQESAACWWTCQAQLPFSSWEDLENHSRAEFLQTCHEVRMMNELWSQYQAPDESVLEYIRSTQELMRWANPDATEVGNGARVIRQCHPRHGACIHSHRYPMLEKLARQAGGLEEHILGEREYAPPCLPHLTFKPSCAS